MGRGRSSSSRGRSSSSRGRSSSSFRSNASYTTKSNLRPRIYYYGDSNNFESSGSSIRGFLVVGIICLILFSLPGLFAIGTGVTNLFESFKWDTVYGICTNNQYRDGFYYSSYEYTVNDIFYENRSKVGWEFPEIVGEKVKIYYLKSNPDEITDEKPITFGNTGGLVFTGLFMAGIGSFPLVTYIVRKRKQKKVIESTTSSEQTEHICAYCGTKYSIQLSNCPNCGAKR